jgi:lipopolysaccharide/colanic/teichoic acid biosynthesis glycosyltransferase
VTDHPGARIPRSRRAFDLACVAILLPLVVLPALLIALLVLLDSPGSVIYRARRVGLGGRRFEMLKFRTMRSGVGGAAISHAGDERITPIGRFLRASRLDELPQLWNVLRGEMRLVGPRPEDECFVADHRAEYELILAVAPGVTGPTQIRFAAAEAHTLARSADPTAHYTAEVLPSKVAIDLAYARGSSLRGDLRLIGLTLLVPIRIAISRVIQSLRSHRVLRPAYAVSAGIGLALLLDFILSSGPPR